MDVCILKGEGEGSLNKTGHPCSNGLKTPDPLLFVGQFFANILTAQHLSLNIDTELFLNKSARGEFQSFKFNANVTFLSCIGSSKKGTLPVSKFPYWFKQLWLLAVWHLVIFKNNKNLPSIITTLTFAWIIKRCYYQQK